MKSELDSILDRLPTDRRKAQPALLWLNAAGDLILALDGGGVLTLTEKNLSYLKADADFEVDFT